MKEPPANIEQVGDRCLPLLDAAFTRAQDVRPSQPITSALFTARYSPDEMDAVTKLQFDRSDILTFHNYNDAAQLESEIVQLAGLADRPMICTEYMARTRGSRFETHLPIFKREGVGCINWGLVSGKTQTIYPWGSEEGSQEPETWFHDILHRDGTPYRPEETEFISEITSGRHPS